MFLGCCKIYHLECDLWLIGLYCCFPSDSDTRRRCSIHFILVCGFMCSGNQAAHRWVCHNWMCASKNDYSTVILCFCRFRNAYRQLTYHVITAAYNTEFSFLNSGMMPQSGRILTRMRVSRRVVRQAVTSLIKSVVMMAARWSRSVVGRRSLTRCCLYRRPSVTRRRLLVLTVIDGFTRPTSSASVVNIFKRTVSSVQLTSLHLSMFFTWELGV